MTSTNDINPPSDSAAGSGSDHRLVRCRNCRFWGEVYSVPYGWPLRPLSEWDKSEPGVSCKCDRIEGVKHDGAHVAGFDEEGIATDGDFGCIHFSANTKPMATNTQNAPNDQYRNTLRKFWEKTKNNELWSGAWRDLDWDDMWRCMPDHARNDLSEILQAAVSCAADTMDTDTKEA